MPKGIVGIRVEDDVREKWERQAKASGESLSDWVRGCLDAACSVPPVSDPLTTQQALAERPYAKAAQIAAMIPGVSLGIPKGLTLKAIQKADFVKAEPSPEYVSPWFRVLNEACAAVHDDPACCDDINDRLRIAKVPSDYAEWATNRIVRRELSLWMDKAIGCPDDGI